MNLRLIALCLIIPLAALAAPPTGERLDAVINAPLSADPVRDNKEIGTTPVAAVATANTRLTREDTQLFVVTNSHSSQNLCFGTVSAVGATCNDALCDTEAAWTSQGYAAKMNCTRGDASEGSLIPGQQSRAFRYDGTRCACIVASSSNTTAQVERVVR